MCSGKISSWKFTGGIAFIAYVGTQLGDADNIDAVLVAINADGSVALNLSHSNFPLFGQLPQTNFTINGITYVMFLNASSSTAVLYVGGGDIISPTINGGANIGGEDSGIYRLVYDLVRNGMNVVAPIEYSTYVAGLDFPTRVVGYLQGIGMKTVYAVGYSAGGVVVANNLIDHPGLFAKAVLMDTLLVPGYGADNLTDLASRAGQVTVPQLLVWGRSDNYAPLANANAWMQNANPTLATLATFDYSHDFASTDAVEVVVRSRIVSFLAGSNAVTIVSPVTTSSTSTVASSLSTSTSTLTSSSTSTTSTAFSSTASNSNSSNQLGDFSLSISPYALSATQASKASGTLTAQSSNGFRDTISLIATDLPRNVTVTFAPNPLSMAKGTNSTVVTVTIPSSSASGNYQFNIVGVGGGIAHQLTVSLSLSGCLIATATFGSELSPEVQFLRNFRDNEILHTFAGSSFMSAFNAWYYSFSPAVANYENNHPAVEPFMRIVLVPLISILKVGASAFNLIPWSPEVAAFLSGITVSVILGGVYLAVPMVLVNRLCPRSRRLMMKIEKPTILIMVFAFASAVLAELFQLSMVMILAAPTIVLATMLGTGLAIIGVINRLTSV